MALLCEELKTGDMTEISQYHHWAVCVEDGYVIHLTPQESERGSKRSLKKQRSGDPEAEDQVESTHHHAQGTHKDLSLVPYIPPAAVVLGSAYTVACTSRLYLKKSYNTLSSILQTFRRKMVSRFHLKRKVIPAQRCTKQFYDNPKPGDLIEIFRTINEHWAICMEGGYVVHLVPAGDISGTAFTSKASGLNQRTVVKKELLEEVLGSDRFLVSNDMDDKYKPRPVTRILQTAEKKIGEEKEYSIQDSTSEHFVISLRYGIALHEQFREEPGPGDRIEIFHNGLQHWAIFMGNGHMIHLTPQGSGSSNQLSYTRYRAVVRKDLLKDVVGNDQYRINNDLDEQCPPWAEGRILSTAEQMVGQEMSSSNLSETSEHFVTYLRYGLNCSEEFCEKPRPGDLIEMFGTGFKHWAVYEGDGYVVHLDPQRGTGFCSNILGWSSKAVVKQESLNDMVGNSHYRVNNFLDHKYPPQSVNKILSDAKEKVGQNMEYNDESRSSEQFVINLRYGLTCNEQFCDKHEPGDLIEIFRSDHQHWAIYVGKDDVVHLAPSNTENLAGNSSVLSCRAVVKQELLKDVVGDCKYRVNNYLDWVLKPQPMDTILRDTKAKIGQNMKYSVPDRTSEHFVTLLRYGVANTKQFCKEPAYGDMIEILCDRYEHWGLYAGDGDMVHLIPESVATGNGSFSQRAVVKRELMKDVVGDRCYVIKNHLDDKYPPLPVDTITDTVNENIGREMEYSDQSKSSEHFVIYLRYGVALDEQCRVVPHPGDMIEIFFTGHKHWALSTGDGYVVHMTSQSGTAEVDSSSTVADSCPELVVKKDLLVDVVGSDQYRINNQLDKKISPWPVDKILADAEKKIGKEMKCKSSEHFVTNLRYGLVYSEQFCEELKTGDLIEIFHDDYEHWALCLGDGYVIHLALMRLVLRLSARTENPTFLADNVIRRAVVKREVLKDVVRGCCFRVNNHSDKCSPLPVNKILSAAKEMIGEKMEYSVKSTKSKDLVTYLRYGLLCDESFCKYPRPGDLLEIFHSGYQSWALCEENGYVTYLPRKPLLRYLMLRRPGQRLLKDVAWNRDCRVNNYLDHKYRPQPVNKMLSATREMMREHVNLRDFSSISKSFFTDVRYGQPHTELFCQDTRPGDLIEIFCAGYKQWAICEEDGYVIHLAPISDITHTAASSITWDLSSKALVKRDLLTDLVQDCAYRVNNFLDHKYSPLPVDTIVSAAKKKVGELMEYNFQSKNSEHFVLSLRYHKVFRVLSCVKAMPGDLIHIFCNGSEDWALYERDDYVVHLAPTDDSKAVVKQELLEDVVGDSHYWVHNHLDHECEPLPVDKILSKAEEKTGEEMGYSTQRRTHEHFVTYLRYGLICQEQFCEEPKPGDLIEIFYTDHSCQDNHEGHDDVIDLDSKRGTTGPSASSSKKSPKSRVAVKQEPLRNVVGSYRYRVNNALDGMCPPLPVSQILGAAKKKIKKDIECSDLSTTSVHFALYLRYGLICSEQFHEELQTGDLIQIFYVDNDHWAIYQEDNYVIHLEPISEETEVDSPVRAVVKRDLLNDIVRNCHYRVNNYLDDKYKPQPVHVIFNSISEMIGMEKEFKVQDRTSMEFVTHLRYNLS